MTFSILLALVCWAAIVYATSLTVVNACNQSLLLFAQTFVGNITQDLVTIDSGASVEMGISINWAGTISTGTGCTDSIGSVCATGGPTWDGQTPFSMAEFDFGSQIIDVVYGLPFIYGYNVGMKISTRDNSCDAFGCEILSGCPVPGPDGSCYSPCCSTVDACRDGALVHGGCEKNLGPGPSSYFYHQSCPNAFAYPDDDGENGFTSTDDVLYYCSNADVTLKLCPGKSSNYTT